VVGSNYDFVGFDPSGVGYSMPSGTSWIGSGVSPLKRRSLIPSINFTQDPHGPSLPKLFFQAAYENATVNGEQCQAEIGGLNDAGPHMTASVNAKDMVSIVDAFAASPESAGVKESGLLNYWDFRYGTFLDRRLPRCFRIMLV
jgi:hypothetical protein